jgi:hypothetical protein
MLCGLNQTNAYPLYLTMTDTFKSLTRTTTTLASLLVFALSALAFAASAMAQDGTIYPLEAPAEPNAIPLGTGGVEGQPAPETWFRQWGDPMATSPGL